MRACRRETASEITCTTPSVPSTSRSPLVVVIDNEMVTRDGVQFSYRNNPNFTSVEPQFTIPAGGIVLTFSGSNLDVAQNPELVLEGERSSCTVVDNETLTCITPAVSGVLDMATYVLVLDDVEFPTTLDDGLVLSVRPDPAGFMLITDSIVPGSGSFVQIGATNLNSVPAEEIVVFVGGQLCTPVTITPEQTLILCPPPLIPELDAENRAVVNVSIGRNLFAVLERKLFYDGGLQASSLNVIIPAVIVPVILILLVAVSCVLLAIRKRYRTRAIHMTAEMKELKTTIVHKDGNKLNALLVAELVQQLPATLIISSRELRMLDISLGQGQFGIVYKAHLTKSKGPRGNLSHSCRDVAVKILKGMFTPADVQSMISEVSQMQDLSHPNVMSLLGVCIDSQQGASIVMPYMANGSLLDYLKKERQSLYLHFDAEIEQIVSVRKLLLRMCHQISLGMCYLTLQKIVHRDLAARNCMLDSEGIIKVSDFGLSEDIYATGYFRQDKEDPVKLPFKWMAPESMIDGVFNEKTDVWSFGVTCWEVFSAGKIPYPALIPAHLPKLLEEGMRLESPSNAANTPEIYSILYKCWKFSPDNRPTFEALSSTLDGRLMAITGYMEVKMVLEPQGEDDMEGYETILAVEEVDEYETMVVGNSGCTATDPAATEVVENVEYAPSSTPATMVENVAYATPATMVENVAYAPSSTPATMVENVAYAPTQATVVEKVAHSPK